MMGLFFWVSVMLIIYVYVGYPIIIALLARTRAPLNYMMSSIPPSVTLIFAANNEEKIIKSKLDNLLLLDYPRSKLQILVVDDGSEDDTAKIVRSFADRGVELVVFEKRRGKLAALKDALVHVNSEIILFSDADNYYTSDALKETVKYFQDSSIGAVSGGRNVTGDGPLKNAEGFYWRYEEFIKRNESRFGSCVGVAGDLLAIRRSVFEPPPDGIINDDFYMALSVIRKGYRVVYAPEARSYHPVAASETGEVERRARMVAGRYQTLFTAWRKLPINDPVALWQVVSHKFLRPFVPFAMITAFFSAFFALLFVPFAEPAWIFISYPFNWIFFVAQIIFYSIALLGMAVKFDGLVGKILYVPVFLLNSNYAALVGFYRYFTSKQTVVWKKATR